MTETAFCLLGMCVRRNAAKKGPGLAAGAFKRARWCVLRHGKVAASLADIAASLILVAIMHHEVEAILVTTD
jgi:hypothetical protein